MKIEAETRCFGGRQLIASHVADSTRCAMRFAIYLPSVAETRKVPVIYFLSGLTCTEQNVITKAAAQRYCEQLGVALVCPDTSPRGEGVPDVDATDLGWGAGFYVNATVAPWATNFRMYDYVTRDLPTVVEANFAVNSARSIMGHSMGGHGALVIGLREAARYRSVSAFSPICNPSAVPWGQKAFNAYLGESHESWERYDVSRLLRREPELARPLLIDIGDKDPFLTSQLRPATLQESARLANCPLTLRMQPGYDHSYYFIATFIGEHLAYHADALGAALTD